MYTYIHIYSLLTQQNYKHIYIYIYIVPMDPLAIKPQVIYPVQGTPEEIKLYDSRCNHYVTRSSWQTTDSWYQWIRFVAGIITEGIEGPHVILVDSYKVHFAHPTLTQELAQDLNVHLYPIVTNATQFCQPMDQYIIPKWKSRIRSYVFITI